MNPIHQVPIEPITDDAKSECEKLFYELSIGLETTPGPPIEEVFDIERSIILGKGAYGCVMTTDEIEGETTATKVILVCHGQLLKQTERLHELQEIIMHVMLSRCILATRKSAHIMRTFCWGVFYPSLHPHLSVLYDMQQIEHPLSVDEVSAHRMFTVTTELCEESLDTTVFYSFRHMKTFLFQLIYTLYAMSDFRFEHRDLKPMNILFKRTPVDYIDVYMVPSLGPFYVRSFEDTGQRVMKLCDYSLSKISFPEHRGDNHLNAVSIGLDDAFASPIPSDPQSDQEADLLTDVDTMPRDRRFGAAVDAVPSLSDTYRRRLMQRAVRPKTFEFMDVYRKISDLVHEKKEPRYDRTYVKNPLQIVDILWIDYLVRLLCAQTSDAHKLDVGDSVRTLWIRHFNQADRDAELLLQFADDVRKVVIQFAQPGEEVLENTTFGDTLLFFLSHPLFQDLSVYRWDPADLSKKGSAFHSHRYWTAV